MVAVAELNELKMAKSQLEAIRITNPAFYGELLMLFLMMERLNIKSGYVCKMVMDVGIEDRYAPKNKDYKQCLDHEVLRIRNSYPIDYDQFRYFLEDHKKVGYTNIFRMLLGETPQRLKG